MAISVFFVKLHIFLHLVYFFNTIAFDTKHKTAVIHCNGNKSSECLPISAILLEFGFMHVRFVQVEVH